MEMTKKELLDKLDSLETEEFCHRMKDRWTPADFEYNSKLNQRIKEIKAKLKALESENTK